MADGKPSSSFLFCTRITDLDKVRLHFQAKQMEEISDEFSKLIRDVQRLAPSPLWSGSGVAWDLSSAERATYFKDYTVVVYFLANQEASKIKKLSELNQVAKIVNHSTTAGLTARTIQGEVISEVYVQDNFPTKKLAHIAFHEMLHNKLDVGSIATADVHSIGGGPGLHNSPTTGWASVTAQEAKLLSDNILRKVKQVTTYL
jgi:hypothetical protein